MTLRDALAAAQRRLADAGDSPRVDAELLLGSVLGLSRAQLFSRLAEPLPAAEAARFETLVAQRARGVPVAYLTGEKGFWTLMLAVTPEVLVPRPETELLVEWGLALLDGRVAPRVADLGTGSGALALALASERPDAQVEATDASPGALALARRNAQALGLERVHFCLGHWCEPLRPGRYDLIVSNPPYIAHDDAHLAALRHEPLAALTDGADGLNALREIVATAPAFLCPDGWLIVEHGFDQGAAVRALFAAAGFEAVTTRRDYGGHERATAGRNARSPAAP